MRERWCRYCDLRCRELGMAADTLEDPAVAWRVAEELELVQEARHVDSSADYAHVQTALKYIFPRVRWSGLRSSMVCRYRPGWKPVVRPEARTAPERKEVLMRTDKMHPLPWRHQTDGRRMTAVLDAQGSAVCGSLLCPTSAMRATRERQTHAFIVRAANALAKTTETEKETV